MNTGVRLKDIALQAQVSVMTVSRALRLDPKVSLEVRKKVQEVARRLGYRPNPLVSALMSYRRAGKPAYQDLVLGFVTAFPARDDWKQFRLYREFYEGAALGARRHGYRLEEFWLTEPGMTARRLSQVLVTRNVPGVLLAPLPGASGSLEMEYQRLAAVTFGHSIVSPGLHRVSNNQFRSMHLLMGKLRELGYRRPGLALPKSLDDRVLHQWLGAFLAESPKAGKSDLPMFLLPDQKWTRERFGTWLGSFHPDVVIAQRNEVLDWLRESGRRVPEDIGYAYLDCPPRDGVLSGICQNGREIGIAAADMLVGALHRNEWGVPELPRTMLIEGAWISGTTTRKQ